jgi:inosose dehydratase
MFTLLKPHLEAGFKMAARFGLHGVEPWANQLQDYLTQPPEVFKKLLDEAGIGISSIASGGEYFDTSKLQATLDSHATNARFGSHFGITALKANLNARLGPENLTPAQGRTLARNLNEVGKRTLEYGVKFAFHPHAWTIVERKAEVEMMLEMTDPRVVFLTLDTCHASVGGIEPVAFVRDHYARIAHLHCKDTLPSWSARGGWQGPAPNEEEELKVAKQMVRRRAATAFISRLAPAA